MLKSSRSRLRVVAVALALVAALAACSSGGSSDGGNGSGAAQKFSVVMGIPYESSNDIITVVLPQELGFFKQEGIDPNFQYSSGANAAQLLVSGKATVAFSTASTVALAKSQGLPIKAFYNLLTDNGTAIAVLADSPVTNPSQLNGKTIGTATVGTGRYFDGLAMFKAAGIADPTKDLKWVSTGIGAQAIHALQSNQVQALVLWNAAYADIKSLGTQLRLFTFPYQKTLFSIVWATSDDAVKNQSDLLVRFGRAEAKATVWAMANPRAAVNIYLNSHPELIPAGENRQQAFAEAMNVLQSNLRDSAMYPGAVGYGGFTSKGWQQVVKYYTNLGVLAKPISNPASMTISNDLIKQMNNFDAAAIRKAAQNYKP